MSFSTAGGVLVANYQDRSSYRFKLGDIDPTSMRIKTYDSQTAGNSCEAFPDAGMVCDIAEMTFETRNQVSLIETEHHFVYPELNGKDHESHSSGRTYEAGIALDDGSVSKRHFDTLSPYAVGDHRHFEPSSMVLAFPPLASDVLLYEHVLTKGHQDGAGDRDTKGRDILGVNWLRDIGE
jgi:hypothetical protein